MSCSADYYGIFSFGLVAPTIMLCDTLACGGGGGGSQRRRRKRHYGALYTGTPYVSSEQLNHKKCAKMYFCKH
jgi:hypothetical protein